MIGKRLVPSVFVLVALGTVPVHAQTSPTGESESRSILGRLDQFGQNLFGGIFGDDRAENHQTNSNTATTQSVPQRNENARLRTGTSHPQQTVTEDTPAPRAGSILTVPSRQPQTAAAPRSSAGTIEAYRPIERSVPQAVTRSPIAGVRSSESLGTVSTENYQRSNTSAPPLSQTPSSRSEMAGMPHPAQRPIHQRLSVLRQSAFRPTPSEEMEPVQPDSAPVAAAPVPAATDPPEVPQEHRMTVARPSLAAQGVPTPAVRPSHVEPTAAQPSMAASRFAERTHTAPRVAERMPAEPRRSALAAPSPSVVQPRVAVGHGDGILFSQRGPVLSVETSGPRTISIGKESSYRVTIQNSGEVGADEVVVFVQLPAWADVLGAEASTGATQLPSPSTSEGAFLWRVGHLGAQTSERLTLRLVPRESRPFDLAVRWEYQPVSQQAMIEVQEPKLELQLEGPREVQHGQQETYKLQVKNTGNGPAENVMITLLPVGAGSNQPVSHRLGLLESGDEKVVEVELTARQTGNITVQVEVRGEGGIHAELAEKILVRRAELQLAADGPQMRFVGSEVVYDLHVANRGNAPARNVKLSAAVPAGAKYVSGIDGGRLEANGTRINWVVPLLEAGSEERYQMRVTLGLPGTNRLELIATADDSLTASTETLTRVEAMADLAMDVQDPSAPVPVGAEATYQVRVYNRGTKAAENVEVFAYFSQGIEPVSAEGGAHHLGPAGQVVFTPIASLAAGSETVFSIRARAQQPGNHVFRAEMHCKPLASRLVREETTHFYQDGSAVAGNSNSGGMNTADRRAAASEGTPSPLPAYRDPQQRR